MKVGLPLVFVKVVDIANCGCIIVGRKGVGKTTIINTIEKRLAHRKVLKGAFTGASLKKTIKKKKTKQGEVEIDVGIGAQLNNASTTILTEDLAQLREDFLIHTFPTMSRLIYEHNETRKSLAYEVDIKNAYISFICACVFETYDRVQQQPEWRGNFSDRFMVYFLLPINRRKITFTIPNVNKKLEDVDVFAFRTTEELRQKFQVDTSDPLFHKVFDMLRNRFTYPRAMQWAIHYAIAHATLNERGKVLPVDYKFLLLHKPNIEAESWFSMRTRPTEPLQFNTDALEIFAFTLDTMGATYEEIQKEFSIKGREVSTRTIGDWVRPFTNFFSFWKTGGNKIVLWIDEQIFDKYFLPQLEFVSMCRE